MAPRATGGSAVDTTGVDGEPSEEGGLKDEPVAKLVGVETEHMREVLNRSGREKDKPKYVAYDYGFQVSNPGYLSCQHLKVQIQSMPAQLAKVVVKRDCEMY